MRLRRFEVLEARFPFRFSFGHASASRRVSTSVLVRAELDNGVVGFGECVPRDYVTGETPESAQTHLVDTLAPAFVGCSAERFEDLVGMVQAVLADVDGDGRASAAQCAIELATLDAYGRTFGRSVADLLGPRVRNTVVYSGVLPFLPPPLMMLGALAHRLYGITTIKLKVGRSLTEDLRNLRILRRVLGGRADLRVDANCAWQPDQAIACIRAMRPYRVRAVEQPVDKDDFAGLKAVAEAVDVPIMADESLRGVTDARRLADERVVDMFNVRISKCGGLLAAKEVASIAERSGLTCQLGPHPGESAILMAAGRQFAVTTPNLRYLEADALNILQKGDIAVHGIPPGRGGRAAALPGPGLGVVVDAAKLEKFVVKRQQVG